MKNNILAVVLGGVVLFVWGFISWAVLPWHNQTANQFSDEAAISVALKQYAPVKGVYYLPFAEEDHKPGQVVAFVNVLPEGFNVSMGGMMGMGLLGQMISALLVVLLLRNCVGLSYGQRVGFVALLGFSIGFISQFPYWNWFGFATAYIVVMILDSLIAWTLAGLVMAKFVPGRQS